MRRVVSVLAAIAAVAAMSVAPNAHSAPLRVSEFVGTFHEHSGYSDGKAGTRPSDYYAAGKAAGLDFIASGEHSDNSAVPVTAWSGCLDDPTTATECIRLETDAVQKWKATLDQAHAATTSTFTGIRGFEWTSDRYGHIGVYFSNNDENAKAEGGYVSMDTFWKWFTRPAWLGGGSDGLATFNHPGAKNLNNPAGGDVDPPSVQNWNDFTFVPEADDRVVGMEVYNNRKEYGEQFFVHALDKGWHIGAMGVEDVHLHTGEMWASSDLPKTIVLAADRSSGAIRDAMLARRFYAIKDNFAPRLQLTFTVDREQMGSRITVRPGKNVRIAATTNRPDSVVEVVTSGGTVVASGVGSLQGAVKASSAQRYYFMRVKSGSQIIGYSSPVWVSAV